ncbi:hypothetical protein [Cupriavidus metallidurans]|nr:hypothetical protein [Cupriavidus metallidurans]
MGAGTVAELPPADAAPDLSGLDALIAGDAPEIGSAETFAAPELPSIEPAPADALAELGSLLIAEGVDLDLSTAGEAAPTLGDTPTMPAATDPAAPVDKAAVRAAADKAKAEEKQRKAAEREERRKQREAQKAEAANKPPAQPKIYFGNNKVGRLQHTLADSIGDFTLFEMKDVEGDVAAKSAENLNAMKELGTKVQNRVTYILEFAAGKSKSLNVVIATALKVLVRDGSITTGDKGNLMKELDGKYALSSARAMANNSVLAMKFLRMVVPGDKQQLVANGDSTLLPVVLQKLEPAAAVAPAEVPVEVPTEPATEDAAV